jgi:hypothetical protein
MGKGKLLAISPATVHKEIQAPISFVVLNKVYTTGILAGFGELDKIDKTWKLFVRFVKVRGLAKTSKKLQTLGKVCKFLELTNLVC